ncbi:hypothetical protein HY969_00600 [Candidatus Kaiserbacteria bacterium]|nr:hypothetical protein [Candidatus Kaiserbacteria bacterium]
MHWFAAHAYITGLIVAGFLLLSGTVLVSQRAPLSGVDSNTTWSGAGISLFSGLQRGSAPQETRIRTEDLLGGQLKNSPYTILPVGGAAFEQTPGTEFNWEALMAELIRQPGSGTQSTEATNLGVYAFIPQGLIAVKEASQERNETQDILFEYGNTIGSFILAFDDSHGNMLQVLKDAYQDRGNAQKVAAAAQIGRDYAQLGAELESISAPSEVGGLHQRLADAYKKVGQLMIAKVQSKNDDDFLAAVHAYNAGVDQFQKDYLALVNLFAVAEVEFSDYDPGRVFMFQSTSGF